MFEYFRADMYSTRTKYKKKKLLQPNCDIQSEYVLKNKII